MKVPPLRERVDDIPALVGEFQKEFTFSAKIEKKRFSGEAIRVLKNYDWPGNVRELKNLVERLMIMTPDTVIQEKDIPSPFNKSSGIKGSFESAFKLSSIKEAKVEFEKAFVEKKLREFKGNISQTAEAMGIERSNLHKKIKAFGINGFRSQ
jgi:two-component system nitrogen regulation response regulator NtrX